MVELSNERVEQIFKEETKKTEAVTTILRGIYARYMHLYENYFSDIEALNDDKIGEFKKYHEETLSLIKYYYMDIPQDICEKINMFEEQVSEKQLLEREWKRNLYYIYDEFKKQCEEWNKSEDYYKAEFSKAMMKEFYKAMEEIFRDGFGTTSETAKNIWSGVTGLLFGKSKD